MDINSILKNHNIDAINDNEKVIDRLVAKNMKEYKNEINEEINENTNNVKTDIENINKRIDEVFICANDCKQKLELKENELLKVKKQLNDTIIGKQQKENELNNLNSQVSNLQSKINSLNNTIFDLEKQSHESNNLKSLLDSTIRERDNALSKINNLQSKINSLNNTISSLNSEISILKNNLGKKWAKGTLSDYYSSEESKSKYDCNLISIKDLKFSPRFLLLKYDVRIPNTGNSYNTEKGVFDKNSEFESTRIQFSGLGNSKHSKVEFLYNGLEIWMQERCDFKNIYWIAIE